MNRIHEAIACAPQTGKVGVHIARFGIGDLSGADQPELHRNLAVPVGLIGQVDAHRNERIHSSLATLLRACRGGVDD